jgi:hypothetical protein
MYRNNLEVYMADKWTEKDVAEHMEEAISTLKNCPPLRCRDIQSMA